MTTAIKQANDDLDAFNLTISEDNEDTPETILEQERLLNAVIAAEASNLPSLSAKELLAHWNKRCAPSEHMPSWKGSKAALIAKINDLPPLAAPEPTPAAEPTPEVFSVAAYALSHGLDARELRKRLRGNGLRAPYTLEQVKALEA